MTELFPADASCAHCGKQSLLSESERAARQFDCPFCKRTTPAHFAAEARCGGCSRTLKLDSQERSEGRFICPYCKQMNVMAGAAPGGPPALRAGLTSEQAQEASRNPATDIVVGSLGIAVGVLITVVSLAAGGSTYVIAIGPVIFGAIRLGRGLKNR